MALKGIWLFGLSGSGKSYLSKKISKQIKNSFIIDGDIVRSQISFDLGYSLRDRKIQNKRVFGLANIAISNHLFPIISSVYLDPKLVSLIQKSEIKLINLISKHLMINKKLRYKKNVVGKSIKQPPIKCKKFFYSFKTKINVKEFIN
tara:strand:- start:56 stop:496 length:441 start_codon:yes stop_codon:yes gene_type:complete